MFRNILYKTFSLLSTQEATAFEKDSHNCEDAQLRKLLQIIQNNASTEYGKKYQFNSIKSVADFQKAVPINDYESLSPYIERIASGAQNILTSEPPFMFATTSGTTGARKLIPVTNAYMQEFRKASAISGYYLLKHFPAIAHGVTLSIFSPAQDSLTTAGLPCGAISGRLYLKEPFFIRKFISPLPYEICLIKDYEARYYTLLRCALMLPVTCIYTLNPSTIALLSRRLKTHAEQLINDVAKGTISLTSSMPANIEKVIKPFLQADHVRARYLQKLLADGQFTPDKVWPGLALITCWTKAAAAFYLQDFPEFFGSTPVCDITYGASEGRGTVFLSPEKQALAIRSHFFEFIEADKMTSDNKEVLTATQLQTGKEYNILFTTSGGLYRYNINDIVQVVGWHNQIPLLEFLHKSGNISSFTGEKLTESQVTQAVADSTHTHNITLRFFTVIPEFRPEPHYQLWLEPSHELDQNQLVRLSESFDQCLSQLNSEYEVKRASHRLGSAQVFQLSANSYEDLRKHLVAQGIPDAQIKISHLNPKEEIKEILKTKLGKATTRSLIGS